MPSTFRVREISSAIHAHTRGPRERLEAFQLCPVGVFQMFPFSIGLCCVGEGSRAQVTAYPNVARQTAFDYSSSC